MISTDPPNDTNSPAASSADATQDKIWDYYQNSAPETFEGSVPRVKHLVSYLQPGSRVLNIGLGTGILERLAVERGIDIHSLDPSAASVENVRERLNLGDKAQMGYCENIPFQDGHFDAVVMSEVLEHLTDESLAAGLQDVHRVLRPGGMLLGTVPARENLADQMVVCPCCAKLFHRWGHHQQFDAPRMTALLTRWFVRVTAEERVYIPFHLLNLKGKAVAAVKLLLHRLGSHGSGENVFFRAHKQE